MSRITITVVVENTDTDDLTDEAISDASAVVHSHHVVHPNPKPVLAHEECVEGVGGDGEPFLDRSYTWEVEILDAHWPQGIYEDLVHYADRNGNAFRISAGDGSSLSYTAGDRAWAAEQAALRGVR